MDGSCGKLVHFGVSVACCDVVSCLGASLSVSLHAESRGAAPCAACKSDCRAAPGLKSFSHSFTDVRNAHCRGILAPPCFQAESCKSSRCTRSERCQPRHELLCCQRRPFCACAPVNLKTGTRSYRGDSCGGCTCVGAVCRTWRVNLLAGLGGCGRGQKCRFQGYVTRGPVAQHSRWSVDCRQHCSRRAGQLHCQM